MRFVWHLAPVAAAIWCAVAPATAPAGPAAPPAAAEARGLATPDDDAWGDEWFDEASRRRAAEIEREMLRAARTPEPAAPQPAQPSAGAAPSPRRIVPPSHGPADLEAAWRARRDALLRQDAATAAAAEDELRRLLLELDVREIHGFAAAAVRESRKLEASAPAEARRRAELAHALAPSLPLTHLQLLRAQLAQDPWAVATVAGLAADAIGEALLDDPRTARLIALDAGVALGLALLVAGGIALAFLVLANARNALHDFHHLFPRGVSRLQTGLLLGMLVLLPVALGLGPLALAAVLLAAVWLYLGRGERIALGGWLAACTLLPGAAGLLAAYVAWDDTPAAALYAVENAGDFRRVRALLEQAQRPDAAPATLFVAARAGKRLGDLDRAEALYRRALELRPRWAEALVNLGNVRFLRGDLDGAESLYAKAIDVAPGLAPAYFDLSRVHYDRANITLGQAARARAVELDPALVERYAPADKGAAAANQYVVDVPLPAADLDAVATARGDRAEDVERELGELLVGPAPAPVTAASGAAFAGLLALATVLLAPRVRPVRSCSRCGRPVCAACDPESAGGNLCGQCMNVFARRAAVDAFVRERKERAVRAWQARRAVWRNAGGLALAGPFLAGSVGWGALLLVAGWSLAFVLAMPAGVVSPMFDGWPQAWKVGAAAPPLAVLLWASLRAARGGR